MLGNSLVIIVGLIPLVYGLTGVWLVRMAVETHGPVRVAAQERGSTHRLVHPVGGAPYAIGVALYTVLLLAELSLWSVLPQR